MKNSPLIFTAITILAVAAVGIFTLTQKSSDTPGPMVKQDETMEKNSRYLEYSKSVFGQAANNRRVLFFYANWCPICQPADASFRENVSQIPEDVALIRVNYNDTDTDQEEKDLAKKYGITYQHTFVQIDQDGKEITKWNGGQIEELLDHLK